jgi:hypothetical protein
MTSPALALSRPGSVRDVLLAGLAGAVALYLVVRFIASSAQAFRLRAPADNRARRKDPSDG